MAGAGNGNKLFKVACAWMTAFFLPASERNEIRDVRAEVNCFCGKTHKQNVGAKVLVTVRQQAD